jgi:hypothetical protein
VLYAVFRHKNPFLKPVETHSNASLLFLDGEGKGTEDPLPNPLLYEERSLRRTVTLLSALKRERGIDEIEADLSSKTTS